MGVKKYIKNFIKYIRTGGKWDGAPIVKVGVSYTLPNERFSGKKVLVTGGGTGIGLAITKAFIAEGADVLIVGRRATILDNVASEMNNDRLHTMVWDVADIPNIGKNFEKAEKLLGGFDVFINNAGICIDCNYLDCTEEIFDKTLDINTKALYYLMIEQAKYCREHGAEHVVNITSITGLYARANPYSISKWGANCVTEAFAKELIRYRTTVNAVAPGAVVTEIMDSYKGIDVAKDAYYSVNPSKRYTLVEEIAALTLFLSSGAANNITGQIIAVDGGRSIL